MLNEPLLPELSLLTQGQREARGSFTGQMLREMHGDSRRIWRGAPMGRRTGSASEGWGLNQASLCGSNCHGANVGMYSQCFRVLRSHCDRRALTRHPPSPSKEPLSRAPSRPSPSPSLANPEHTSSLAAGVGEQRQLCRCRRYPLRLIAVIAWCFVFVCIYPVSGSHPLSFSWKASCSLL